MKNQQTQPRATISRTAWMDASETLELMMALCGGEDDQGDEARFVGGCVRDAILNIKSFDIDIATIFPPDDVIRRLKAAEIKTIPTGIAHGTVTAIIGDSTFEITTLRRDVETDGRHAVVAFTDDWREDARRRDFTMNALYCTIRGEVYDYFGGLEDAKSGNVRFIDDAAARIKEDYLRILRFYRFNARYGRIDKIDKTARAACRNHAERLADISAERVQNEILKLLAARDPAPIWRIMVEDHITDVILPGLDKAQNLARLVALENAFESTGHEIRRLAALIGRDSSLAFQTAEKLKLSNADKKALLTLCDPKGGPAFDSDEKALRRAVYESNSDIVRSRLLLTAARDDITVEKLREAYDFTSRIRLPAFPVTGADVLKRGVEPGPDFGRILKKLETLWVKADFKPGRTEMLTQLDKLI